MCQKQNAKSWWVQQVLAAFFGNMGTINTGMMFGFSAVAIPQLKAPDSFIQINEDQASWIGECIYFVYS